MPVNAFVKMVIGLAIIFALIATTSPNLKK